MFISLIYNVLILSAPTDDSDTKNITHNDLKLENLDIKSEDVFRFDVLSNINEFLDDSINELKTSVGEILRVNDEPIQDTKQRSHGKYDGYEEIFDAFRMTDNNTQTTDLGYRNFDYLTSEHAEIANFTDDYLIDNQTTTEPLTSSASSAFTLIPLLIFGFFFYIISFWLSSLGESWRTEKNSHKKNKERKKITN